MRLSLLTFILLVLPLHSVFAAQVIFQHIPNAAIVGRGVYSVALWDVYEAVLYAPDGRWNASEPFALSIKYYRDIKGRGIADRSVQEMRGLGFRDEVKLAAWNTQMKNIFPDVNNGSVLSAVYFPGKKTVFYSGEKAIGSINGDEFARLFFGIWLDEKTSAPELRRALLGL